MMLYKETATAEADAEVSHFTLSIEEHMLICTYTCSHITLPLAKKVLQERMRLMEEASLPALLNLNSVVKIDKEVRYFFALEESNKHLNAIAILVKSLFQEVASHFYIFFNKPPLPVKIFSDEKEALRWLEKHRNN